MLTSAINAMAFGVDKIISGPARLLVTSRVSTEGKDLGVYQYQIDGVVLSDELQEQINGKYSMLECEVIIIPKRIHKKFIRDDRGTLGMMLTSGYAEPNNWETHEDFK